MSSESSEGSESSILVGPATGHQLIDGGGITVPGARLYDNDGHWFWEGVGVSPDIEVWDDPNMQTTATATALAAGNYNVTVTDSNGCPATIFVEIDQPKEFSVIIFGGDATCANTCDGVAVASTLGGT